MCVLAVRPGLIAVTPAIHDSMVSAATVNGTSECTVGLYLLTVMSFFPPWDGKMSSNSFMGY